MNNDGLSAIQAYANSQHYLEPSPSISLDEASLMDPSTPCYSRANSLAPQYEKKAVKKRKSWGQELPTPKTNLPPRKRAKTADEKEQRRVERVLRNRAAAQSSRERKRLEVERLEGEKATIEYQNQLLRQRLLAVEHDRFNLKQEVIKLRTALGVPASDGSLSTHKFAPQIQIPISIKKECEDYHQYSIPIPPSSNTVDPRSSLSSPSSDVSRSPSPSRAEDVVWPAVSIQRSPARADSNSSSMSRRSSVSVALTTASTCESSPHTGNAFGRHFEHCYSPETAEPTVSFFEEELATHNDANLFTFDSMVDLDADRPKQADEFVNFDHQNQDHFHVFNTNDSTLDFSHQSAATSSV